MIITAKLSSCRLLLQRRCLPQALPVPTSSPMEIRPLVYAVAVVGVVIGPVLVLVPPNNIDNDPLLSYRPPRLVNILSTSK